MQRLQSKGRDKRERKDDTKGENDETMRAYFDSSFLFLGLSGEVAQFWAYFNDTMISRFVVTSINQPSRWERLTAFLKAYHKGAKKGERNKVC